MSDDYRAFRNEIRLVLLSVIKSAKLAPRDAFIRRKFPEPLHLPENSPMAQIIIWVFDR
jgi:hypothetical protein